MHPSSGNGGEWTAQCASEKLSIGPKCEDWHRSAAPNTAKISDDMKSVFATIILLVASVWIVALADTNEFQACTAAGNSPDLCAACTNPSRGDGTSGSTAVCLCKTQLAKLGQPAFDQTYGNFGKCIDLEHAHGVQ